MGSTHKCDQEPYAGDVSATQLIERSCDSKPPESYTQNVVTLKRARDHDLTTNPGEDIEDVVDDE